MARPTDGRAVASPLDVLNGKDRLPCATGSLSARAGSPPQKPSVGRLQLHFKPQTENTNGLRAAKVTIGIPSDPQTVYLTGIIAREVRKGWITLEIPPLEQWEQPLRWLTQHQRERIEDADFFELLQREIPKRLLALDSS